MQKSTTIIGVLEMLEDGFFYSEIHTNGAKKAALINVAYPQKTKKDVAIEVCASCRSFTNVSYKTPLAKLLMT